MILGRLRGKKKEKGPEIARSEFLKIKPVRNPALRYEQTEKGGIKVFIPIQQPEQKKKRRRKRILQNIAPTPREKQIQLDPIGSIVWELCDGEKTVKDIVGHLHEKYKLLPSEAEISLNAYFTQLSKRGLVGFIVPEELRTRLEEKAKEAAPKK